MVENAFLTDSRRAVLDGSTDLTDQSLYNAKSRIRTRSRMALQELIEVANSPEIDNAEVFDPQLTHLLLDALFRDGQDRLTPLWDFEGNLRDYSDEFAYQKALHSSLSQSMMMYGEAMTTEEQPSGMWAALLAQD